MKNLILLLATVFAFSTAPFTWAGSVTVKAGTVDGRVGARVAVPIELQGAQKLGALQLELIYDPAILEPAAEAVEKGTLSQDTTLAARVVTSGVLRLVMNGSEHDAIDGDGILMRALFTVKGGSSCELRLENVKAWDNPSPEATPTEMLVKVEHGRFTAGFGWKRIAYIAGGALLLLLILSRLIKGRQPPSILPVGQNFCGQCGAPRASDAKFCPSCGKPV